MTQVVIKASYGSELARYDIKGADLMRELVSVLEKNNVALDEGDVITFEEE